MRGTKVVDKREWDRLKSLEAAVIKMLSQRGDDICWRDLYVELAKLVGVEFHPALMDDPAKMLENCQRFIASLYGGKYTPVYVERNPVVSEGNCDRMACKETGP